MNIDFTRACYAFHLSMDIGVTILDCKLQTVFELHAIRMPIYFAVGNTSLYEVLWKKASGKLPHEYLYYFDDRTGLSYLALGVWEEKMDYLAIIGPFISNPTTSESVLECMQKYNYPLIYKDDLQRYLNKIPYKSSEVMAIGEIACTIFRKPLLDCALSKSEEENPISLTSINEEEKLLLKDLEQQIQTMYLVEARFYQAIRAGNTGLALEINNQFPISFHYRMPRNAMRIEKNTTYSYSTVMRMAALDAGVSPSAAHSISDHFSYLIENAKTPKDIAEINVQLIQAYCQAVQENPLHGSSEVVRRAVTYINCYYHEPISLKSVAAAISFHPSYLAKSFKKEMGKTVVDYVNQLRIEHAVKVLRFNPQSITEIALQAGFSNYSYFSTVFKRYTGLTCSEYIKQMYIGRKK